jgi:PAP2 superfamily
MVGAAFYSYLYACTESRYVKIAAVALIVLVGISRPYLGVHYLEDIVIGWIIGAMIGAVAVYQSVPITEVWERFSHKQQIGIAVGFSAILWLATVALNGWRIDGQPRAFLCYAGFLTGIVIGRPLELAMVNFASRSSGFLGKTARYLLSVGLVTASLESLGALAHAVVVDFSVGGYICQYVRYTAVGVVDIFCGTYGLHRDQVG